MNRLTLTRRGFGASAAATAMVVRVRAARAAGTLRIAREQDSTTMDPALTVLNSDIWVLQNMHSLLVRVNPDATEIVPDLAESWEVSSDGLAYTFHLREGIVFSDGSPVKASDAKFSILRIRDRDDAIWSGMFKIVKDVETPDDRTVVFHLNEPSAPFLSQLAMYTAAILPEAVVNERGDDFGNNPVGAGAFKFVEWKRGDVIRLEKNPLYWEAGKPILDAVEWYYIPNDNTRILKLQAGELDAILFVPFNRISELEGDANLKVLLDPSSRMDAMLVNHEHSPLDNKEVRKALNMAIDIQSILDVATSGYGTAANSFISAGAMFYNPDNPAYPYDPDKAKQMLAEQGAEGVNLTLLINAGDAVYEQIAVLVKDQLAKVGVGIDIVKQESGQAWESTIAGDFDLSINYWTNDIIDPDEKAAYCLYGIDDNKSYSTRYHNPKVTELVDQGRRELDPEKRKAIYYEMQRIAKDDVHWIDLFYSPFRNASRANVSNLVQNPMGRFNLEDVSVS